jgi:hypothetical protein
VIRRWSHPETLMMLLLTAALAAAVVYQLP